MSLEKRESVGIWPLAVTRTVAEHRIPGNLPGPWTSKAADTVCSDLCTRDTGHRGTERTIWHGEGQPATLGDSHVSEGYHLKDWGCSANSDSGGNPRDEETPFYWSLMSRLGTDLTFTQDSSPWAFGSPGIFDNLDLQRWVQSVCLLYLTSVRVGWD